MSLTNAEPMPLTPAERRERNRQEMRESILSAARSVMREHGVAALNLNEVARRVHLRPQSLAEYFPNKAALYDAIVVQALAIFREGDEAAFRDHPPGWKRIEAWFQNRIDIAMANPDMYHLLFDAPVPDYLPDERVRELTRGVLVLARTLVAESIEAGEAVLGDISVEQATDILLSIRRGIVAERIGKQRFVDAGRFEDLVPLIITLLRSSWGPATTSPDSQRLSIDEEEAPMRS